jgi:hypothetical protein
MFSIFSENKEELKPDLNVQISTLLIPIKIKIKKLHGEHLNVLASTMMLQLREKRLKITL